MADGNPLNTKTSSVNSFGSPAENSSFGDFMKAYESRKAKGAEGVTLLSGVQDEGASSSSQRYFGSFISNTRGNYEFTSTSVTRSFGYMSDTIGSTLQNSFQGFGSSLNLTFGSVRGADIDIESGKEIDVSESVTATSTSVSDSWSSFSRTERFKGFMFLLCLSGIYHMVCCKQYTWWTIRFACYILFRYTAISKCVVPMYKALGKMHLKSVHLMR